MASVYTQLIEEVIAHAQSDSLEDAWEICADSTYFPNNLHTLYPLNTSVWVQIWQTYRLKSLVYYSITDSTL